MKLIWLGHACFALESGDYRIVIDPYHEVDGCADVDTWANAVYKSHDHHDHNYFEGVEKRTGGKSPFLVEMIDTRHDGENGALRGDNTVHIFSAEGFRVAHLGDLGHALSPAQLAAIGAVDAVLIPIGGTYTLDPHEAKAAADAIGARVTVPMHYREGEKDYAVLRTAEEFTALFAEEEVYCLASNELELTPDMKKGVYRLAFQA
ncbi:MAG: MBL fold metallo-hydrolase [Oscillospiraceae bacterium]|nr:MBL fold metallo-hydrolase [Oscillospiraceae bacterium]